MSRKFGRNYRLTVYPIDGGAPIVLTQPLTIRFTCVRAINSAMNNLNINIYNLSAEHRARIFQDLNVLGQYANGQVTASGQNPKFFNLLLEAGYSTLYRVFYGRMQQASTAREGTNLITRIEGLSSMLDIAGTQIQTTFRAGQKVSDILNFLASQFPNLKIGAIGNYDAVLTRPVSLNGVAWELLKQYSDRQVYIDNGNVYVLKNNEVLNGNFTINDATGLLETPRREFGKLIITTLMETRITTIGQTVNLQSSVQREYNGVYKVIGIQHQGTISEAVCGDMRSIFTLQAQSLFNGFTTVNPVTAH